MLNSEVPNKFMKCGVGINLEMWDWGAVECNFEVGLAAVLQVGPMLGLLMSLSLVYPLSMLVSILISSAQSLSCTKCTKWSAAHCCGDCCQWLDWLRLLGSGPTQLLPCT